MNILLLILAGCALSVVFSYRAFRMQELSGREGRDLQKMIKEVDLIAFKTLIDPADEVFLRSALSPAEFRRVQRDRNRVVLAYVSAVAFNAGIFVWLGEQAAARADAELATAGHELSAAALKLRMRALRAQLYLTLSLLLPMVVSSDAILLEYETIKGAAARVSQLNLGSAALAS